MITQRPRIVMMDGSPLPERACWHCAHFNYIRDPAWPFVQGECRQRSPGRKGWPTVKANDTCGKFKPVKP